MAIKSVSIRIEENIELLKDVKFLINKHTQK